MTRIHGTPGAAPQDFVGLCAGGQRELPIPGVTARYPEPIEKSSSAIVAAAHSTHSSCVQPASWTSGR